MRLLLAIAVVALSVCQAHGCLWDSDTANGSHGHASLSDALTGRIARNPPLYYEMRLERVAGELESRPDELGLYDDAAVAADRLGRSADAIEWMRRKKARMDAMPEPPPEHLYRHRANLGTFHAHRWIADGARRDDMGDLGKAKELISEAIVLNPGAHFGRERYQLMAVEWMMAPTVSDNGAVLQPWFVPVGNFEPSATWSSQLADAGYGDVFRGIVGLMAQGAAAGSVDAIRVLERASAAEGDSYGAYMARLRIRELEGSGAKSLRPDIKHLQGAWPFEIRWHAQYETGVARQFRKLRRNADAWNSKRSAFMLAQLAAGKHPDTDRDFWNGYRAVGRPSYGELLFDWLRPIFAAAFIVFVVPAAFARWLLGRRRWHAEQWLPMLRSRRHPATPPSCSLPTRR